MMSTAVLLTLVAALQTRPLFADFFFQNVRMLHCTADHKHPDGLSHAGAHGTMTVAIMAALGRGVGVGVGTTA